MNESCDPIYDKLSLLLFVDEGCLFQKILMHSKRYPDSAPYLMNTIFPFCSLIVHDSVRFVRKYFDSSFRLDSQSVNRLRNATKLLSSTRLGVEEYSAEVEIITNSLNKRFKNHTGILGNLKNSIQPDVGVGYYKDMPVYTTFNMSRYLSKYNPNEVTTIFEADAAKNMGYDIGQAASVSYYAVEAMDIDSDILTFEEFSLTGKDFHYSNLLKPIAGHGLVNPVYFFMLCEGLTQLNSITALCDSNFFSDLLRIKMTTTVLVALEKSLSKLSRYIMNCSEFESDPIKVTQTLSKIISREQRKTIKKSKGLRDALVHYDFIKLLGGDICKSQDVEAILNAATQRTVGMMPSDYLDWLRKANRDIANEIESLVMLPR